MTPGPKETVADLQKRIRPTVELLKNKPPPASEPLRVKRLDPLSPSTPSSWSPVKTMDPPKSVTARMEDGCPFSHELRNMELRVQDMMQKQDVRFQSLLRQVMETVHAGPPLAAGQGAYPIHSDMSTPMMVDGSEALVDLTNGE